MRVSAAIMAHPVRRAEVEELQASLDRDIPVSWATNREPSKRPEARWQTGRAAWQMHDPAADWHIVIQDDAIVSADLLAALEKAVEHITIEAPMSPYLGTKRPAQQVYLDLIRQATRRRASWIRGLSINWGVAIAAPTSTIPDMLRWCDTRRTMPYDMRIGRYYRDHLRVATWYTWPSLVDHRQGPSLVGHGDEGRHAHRHHASSALHLTWDGPIVDDPRLRGRLRTN